MKDTEITDCLIDIMDLYAVESCLGASYNHELDTQLEKLDGIDALKRELSKTTFNGGDTYIPIAKDFLTGEGVDTEGLNKDALLSELTICEEQIGKKFKETLMKIIEKINEFFSKLIAYNRKLEKDLDAILGEGSLKDSGAIDKDHFSLINIPFYKEADLSKALSKLENVSYTAIDGSKMLLSEALPSSIIDGLSAIGIHVKDDAVDYDTDVIQGDTPLGSLGWNISEFIKAARQVKNLLNNATTNGRSTIKTISREVAKIKDDETNKEVATELRRKLKYTQTLASILNKLSIGIARRVIQVSKKVKHSG